MHHRSFDFSSIHTVLIKYVSLLSHNYLAMIDHYFYLHFFLLEKIMVFDIKVPLHSFSSNSTPCGIADYTNFCLSSILELLLYSYIKKFRLYLSKASYISLLPKIYIFIPYITKVCYGRSWNQSYYLLHFFVPKIIFQNTENWA